MNAQPLIIDGDRHDIRYVASPLELQNRKTVRDAYDFNVRLRAQKERERAILLDMQAFRADRTIDMSRLPRFANPSPSGRNRWLFSAIPGVGPFGARPW